MLKLNRKIEYSLMALKIISNKNNGELTSAREISHILKTPFDTISKVLQILNKHEIVSSIKGTNGGYTLTRDLQLLNFVELSNIIEQKKGVNQCISSTSKCSLYDSCNIITPIDNLNKKVNHLLEQLSIKEILEVKEVQKDKNEY